MSKRRNGSLASSSNKKPTISKNTVSNPEASEPSLTEVLGN